MNEITPARISKWGNSIVATIPKRYAKRFEVGDTVGIIKIELVPASNLKRRN